MTARILPPSVPNIALAAEEIRRGQVVAIPTETVYGLAGAAFNKSALIKIFEVKERPSFDPLIIHVPISNLERLAGMGLIDLDQLSGAARQRAEGLAQAFWPGPFTLVLPKQPAVPDLATSGLPTVALRMPRHPVARAVIEQSGTPLAGPSANRFGRISPTSAQDVLEELGDRIAYILDGGCSEVGLESTVISIDYSGALVLLRPGAISASEIERVAESPVHLPSEQAASISGAPRPRSPGRLEQHYAPQKPLYLLPAPLTALAQSDSLSCSGASGLPEELPSHLGLLVVSGDAGTAAAKLARLTGREITAKSLSSKGDLEEAARNLFSALRSLDTSAAQLIFAERSTVHEGLGYAINDRLRRASVTKPMLE
ncbi:MAG: L-threonylcarbamoyladenylate synthase [Acidobacteriota bacterium]